MGGHTQPRNAAALGHYGETPQTEIVAMCINAPTEEMNTVLAVDLELVTNNRTSMKTLKQLCKTYRVKQTGKKFDVQNRLEKEIKLRHAKNIGTQFNGFIVSAERPSHQLPTDEAAYRPSKDESKHAVEAILQLEQALSNLKGEGLDKLRKSIEQAIRDNQTSVVKASQKFTKHVQLINLGKLLDESVSDATIWNLGKHLVNASRAAKPLPGARKLPQYDNKRRISAAVTTSYNYQKKGQQRHSKYWQPINLPILDVLSMQYHTDTRGRQGCGTDAVKVARIEPRCGYINSDDSTRWIGRARITPKSNVRTLGRIVRTIIEVGTDYEPCMVWAFAPIPIGWDMDGLDAWLASHSMAVA